LCYNVSRTPGTGNAEKDLRSPVPLLFNAIGQPRSCLVITGALPCQGTRHCNIVTSPCQGFNPTHKMPTTQPKSNPRGAPKGNLNALKNGFYSRLFHFNEISAMNEDETSSLEHEITLLRVMMRRTMELADGIDDLREATRVLDALGAAAGRLANLLRVQKSMNEPRSQVADEISIAIQQVNAELRKKHV
jgi:hypothetical protein